MIESRGILVNKVVLMRRAMLVLVILFSLSINTFAGGKYLTQGNFPICLSKSDFNKLIDYQIMGDSEAVKKLGIQGRCSPLKAGIEVELISRSRGLVQIRPIGELWTAWTNLEAIRAK